jgi:flotillin
MKSLPPMNELFDMAGMELPEYLGKDKQRELEKQTKADAAESKAAETEENTEK